jgi:hypothetical protein
MSFWNKLFSNAPETTPTLPPSAGTPPSGDLSCTMKLWETGKDMPNPTEADIWAAVTGLEDSQAGPRLRLTMNWDGSQIELIGTPHHGFALDYREGGAREGDYFYSSRRCDYSADDAIKVLIAYRNGKADWSAMVQWKKLRL